MRGPQQDRIDFLAQLRNRALEPLWLGAEATSESSDGHGALHKGASSWEFFTTKDKSRTMWPAEKVVFLNDVFFCARDVFR